MSALSNMYAKSNALSASIASKSASCSLMCTSVRARPSLPRLKSICLSPQYRTFRTSSLRLARPSISSIGPVQPTVYINALDALYAELADLYPNGRAKYKPNQIPAQCPPLPVRKKIETSYNIATTKGRCSLIDMDTAREFVRGALAIGEGEGGRRKKKKEGRVIIEAFPGPGAITRALLELPRSEMKRVIVLEEELKYLRLLKELEYYDDRVHVLPSSGFIWETYDEIRDLGLLDDVSAENWKPAFHSTLSFIGHLPLGPVGEQLIAQLFRSIPERSWLFKYGRMRMSWLLSKRMLDRIECPPKRASRCKLTIIAEATAELTRVMPDEALADYNWLFVPRSDPTSQGKKIPLARRMGQPFVALNIDPLADGAIMDRMEANELIAQAVINSSGSKSTPGTSKKAKDDVKRMIEESGVQDVLDEADAKGLIKGASARKRVNQKESHHTVMSDLTLTEVVPVPTKEGARVTLAKWDYVLRQLFILKSTPLEKSIQNLGAGASILLSKLTGPDVPEERRVNIKLPINALTVQDFARIVEEFDRWPFAPNVLFIADLGDEARN